MREELRKLEADKKSTAKSNKELIKKNEDLMKKIEELELQNSKLQDTGLSWCKLAEKSRKQFKEVRKEIARMKKDHDAVNDKLKQKVDEKNELQSSLDATLDEKESIAQRYEELAREQKSTNAALKKIEAERKIEMDSMIPTKAQLALTMLENAELKKEVQNLKVENKARAENIAEIKAQLDKVNSQLKTSTMEKTMAKQHAQNLDIALEHYKDESEKYKVQSETYQKEKDELQRALYATESQLEELETSERKKDATIADLTQKVQDMNKVLNHVAKEKENLMRKLAATSPGELSSRHMSQSRAYTNSWLNYFNGWIHENGNDMALLVPTHEQPPIPSFKPMPLPMGTAGTAWETLPLKVKQEPLDD